MKTKTLPDLEPEERDARLEDMFIQVAKYQIDRDFFTQMRQRHAAFSAEEVRALFDLYDDCQRMRIRQGNRVAACKRFKKPVEVCSAHYYQQFALLEENAAKNLIGYVKASPRRVVQWALEVDGAGPILVAGLAAHIDITRAPHVSSLWRFAGQDPTEVRKKGQKRQHCAALKRICFLLGKSFVYQKNNPEARYAQLYVERKAQELERNVSGAFAAQAKEVLAAKHFEKKTVARKCYEAGLLPPAHLDARARRYAVKMFLSHWYEIDYEETYGKPPENPWIIGKEGHSHWEKAVVA